MHHSGARIVGYGIIDEHWDKKIHMDDRLFYIKASYEYRIKVKWDNDYDCRKNPLPISGRLPYGGYYSRVDQKKWDVNVVLQDLKKAALSGKDKNDSNDNF